MINYYNKLLYCILKSFCKIFKSEQLNTVMTLQVPGVVYKVKIVQSRDRIQQIEEQRHVVAADYFYFLNVICQIDFFCSVYKSQNFHTHRLSANGEQGF